MNVGQLMNCTVRTCRLDDTLRGAAEIMSKGACGSLPVVGGDGRIVAIVTDRDLCMAACRDALPVETTPVSKVACYQPVTIRENASAMEAEQLMRNHHVRRLPVVDGESRPLGLLSLYDLARHAYWAGSHGDQLTTENVVTTEIAVGHRSDR